MTDKVETKVRREQIAQAVVAVVATKGLKGLSVAAVARRVGLVPSAIYRHFPRKDAMIDAALDQIGERLRAMVRAVIAERSDAPGQLKLLLRRHIEMIKSNQAFSRLILSDDVQGGRAERRARGFRVVERYLAEVADLVREGQKARTVRRDLDPATVSLMFFGLVQPAAILWQLSDGEWEITRHAERAWIVFNDAIRAK
jgi:AcrR family transcriptional regulator